MILPEKVWTCVSNQLIMMTTFMGYSREKKQSSKSLTEIDVYLHNVASLGKEWYQYDGHKLSESWMADLIGGIHICSLGSYSQTQVLWDLAIVIFTVDNESTYFET